MFRKGIQQAKRGLYFSATFIVINVAEKYWLDLSILASSWNPNGTATAFVWANWKARWLPVGNTETDYALVKCWDGIWTTCWGNSSETYIIPQIRTYHLLAFSELWIAPLQAIARKTQSSFGTLWTFLISLNQNISLNRSTFALTWIFGQLIDFSQNNALLISYTFLTIPKFRIPAKDPSTPESIGLFSRPQLEELRRGRWQIVLKPEGR